MPDDRELLPDDVLFELLRRGDIEAFGMICDRYAHRALHVTGVMFDDEHQAFEAASCGFLNVWRRRHEPLPESTTVDHWLMEVMRDSTRMNTGHAHELDPGCLRQLTPEEEKVIKTLVDRLPRDPQQVMRNILSRIAEADEAAEDEPPPATERRRFGRPFTDSE